METDGVLCDCLLGVSKKQIQYSFNFFTNIISDENASELQKYETMQLWWIRLWLWEKKKHTNSTSVGKTTFLEGQKHLASMLWIHTTLKPAKHKYKKMCKAMGFNSPELGSELPSASVLLSGEACS